MSVFAWQWLVDSVDLVGLRAPAIFGEPVAGTSARARIELDVCTGTFLQVRFFVVLPNLDRALHTPLRNPTLATGHR